MRDADLRDWAGLGEERVEDVLQRPRWVFAFHGADAHANCLLGRHCLSAGLEVRGRCGEVARRLECGCGGRWGVGLNERDF